MDEVKEKSKAKTSWNAKKVTLGSAIVGGFIALVVGLVVGAKLPDLKNQFAPYLGIESDEEYALDWTPLNEIYSKLKNTYNGDIDDEKVIEGAKKGLVEALGDEYTVYMTADESSDFYDDLNGEVGAGIGVVIGLRNNYVRVLRTTPDNPAREAGILAGDILYKVDGEEVYDLSSDEIAQKIRGAAGTDVTVTVVRDNQELDFTMTREEINNVSAYVEYDGETAILYVTRFSKDTGELAQNLAKDFSSHNVKKVILDLRDNTGGYVSAAADLLSLWIDNQPIVTQKSLHLGKTTTKTSAGKAILANMKTIVLVNGSTASASEIVAGALQDYGKATIVGEKTFGKGVVQSLYEMSGNSILKVTTAEWYTPNDRSINKTGITPDVEVERSYDDINNMVDPQLDRAKEL